MVRDRGIARVTILATSEQIPAGFDISGIEVIDLAQSEHADAFAQKLYDLRKAKGLSLEDARELIKNELYFGCMMVKTGQVDGMVAGAVFSTREVLRAALQVIGMAPAKKLASSFLIMVVPRPEGEGDVFLFSDCGLLENPDADMLSEIAISSADSFETLVGEPARVALLSYSTRGSASSPLTEKVVEATELVREKRPDIAVDGELQVDAAIVESVGAAKAPDSAVAGKANVLIFPDLNAGNISYKLVQRLAKAEAYGPITQGLAAPINDLSRGCSADDIVGAVAITAVQASGA